MTWDASMVAGARRRLREQGEAREAANRARREDMLQAARRCAGLLAEAFGARRVLVFGSVALGGVDERSDLDLAVEGVPPGRYFEALAKLGDVTSAPIDLILLEEASPSLMDRVRRDGIVLHGE